MEGQKQNEMVCAQNLMISQNDGERENHIDDGEQTAATTNYEDGQSPINELLPTGEAMLCTMALVLFSSAQYFSRYCSRKFTIRTGENERISR